MQPKPIFDHEKLHVYQAALQFFKKAHGVSSRQDATPRSLRDQLVRASQSVPLNIAEGNGKRSRADRMRYFEIARGSATECAAALDCFVAIKTPGQDEALEMKMFLARVVAMLTKMTDPVDRLAEDSPVYGDARNSSLDYEHDHEHEWDNPNA